MVLRFFVGEVDRLTENLNPEVEGYSYVNLSLSKTLDRESERFTPNTPPHEQFPILPDVSVGLRKPRERQGVSVPSHGNVRDYRVVG